MVRRKKRSPLITASILFLFFSALSFAQDQHLIKLTVKDYPRFSRVIIELTISSSFDIEKIPPYLMVNIESNLPSRIQRKDFKSQLIQSIGWSKARDHNTIAIKTKLRDFSFNYSILNNPPQLIIDINQNEEERVKTPPSLRKNKALKEAKTLPKESSTFLEADTPFQFFQGKKIIVIDPGHGGLDVGARGKFGTLEKDTTLAVSLKLREIIERNSAFHVVLTREEDINVPLENRAAIANNNRADLFISVHANSSYLKEARGSSTFFLSKDATDEEARRLAYLENNPMELEEGITGENEDEVKMILWDMAQTAYLKQSSQLAESIQKELNLLMKTINRRIRDRGIKQAPFKVLIGVACPAVLVEVAFISNPDEERELLTEEFQDKVAQAIYDGLMNYFRFYYQE